MSLLDLSRCRGGIDSVQLHINLDVFITLANTLSQTSATASASKETVLKGLVLALLGLAMARALIPLAAGLLGV
jgi:hypothetical protein